VFVCVCAVTATACQRRLLCCMPYKCPMIACFGSLERQVKVGLSYGHFDSKHLLRKDLTTTFLGDGSAAENFCSTKHLILGSWNAC
jgi:hypothetical protein